ncbi:myelin protein zero-like protein 3 [Brienomyrus brachyistius]|uniref:myelin protein zero-like protein 3 n=1 Tax=Brienomyrus brachyistius TaxID=42636 RepID=UPI0020B2C85E|nr:myelin protein zero-like protein 3 [Brienomyrus brachyistius]
MGCPQHPKTVLFRLLILSFALCPVRPMQISCSDTLQAIQGEVITLSCSFYSTSPASSHTSVEWSYRAKGGGDTLSVFHFISQPYLPTEGSFMGRIKWPGNLARGDASLQLHNASLSDNGTYTCAVRNPPGDVHGSPCQTELTVTPRGTSVRFSDMAVLMAFILIPSAIITLVLLGSICCSWHEKATVRRSPIEVTDVEEFGHSRNKMKNGPFPCCELYLQESANDEEFCPCTEKHEKEPIAESQC